MFYVVAGDYTGYNSPRGYEGVCVSLMSPRLQMFYKPYPDDECNPLLIALLLKFVPQLRSIKAKGSNGNQEIISHCSRLGQAVQFFQTNAQLML